MVELKIQLAHKTSVQILSRGGPCRKHWTSSPMVHGDDVTTNTLLTTPINIYVYIMYIYIYINIHTYIDIFLFFPAVLCRLCTCSDVFSH